MTAIALHASTEQAPTFTEIVARYDLPPLLTLALDRLLPHNRDTTPTAALLEANGFLAAWLRLFNTKAIEGHAAPESTIEWKTPAEIIDLYEFEDEQIAWAVELILESAVYGIGPEFSEGTQIADAIDHISEAITIRTEQEAANDG